MNCNYLFKFILLGISLFERMVMNDIQCHTLNVQHRMRPEISRLITPAIYPQLFDHESVETFPNVTGMVKNVFFIDHNELEASAGESSKKNVYEAKFLVQLAIYLIQNGYSPKEITILTAYLGQVAVIMQERDCVEYPKIDDVSVKSVDDFQGEENKIILLSLVRSNENSRIGFLATRNRVCVALSRAKEGLYIIGNMSQLASQNKVRTIKKYFVWYY